MSPAKVPDKEKKDDPRLHTLSNKPKSCKDNPNSTKSKNSNITPSSTPSKTTTPPSTKSPKTPAKISAKKYGTPKSVPLRPRPGRGRVEPSFLEDFLLGRSGTHRVRKAAPARRASLEAVKADIKSEYVSRLQGPSKVKDRVKQWQESTAMSEGLNDTDLGARSVLSDGTKEIRVDDSSNVKPQVAKGSLEKSSRDLKKANLHEKNSPISQEKKAAPKKHVRHDSHWMKHELKSPHLKENNLPKNYLPTATSNPPLEKKIQDWIKKTDIDKETTWVKSSSKGMGKNSADKNDINRTKEANVLNSGSSSHINTSSCSQQKNGSCVSKGPIKTISTNFNDSIRTKPYSDLTKQTKRDKNSRSISIDNGTQKISKLGDTLDKVENSTPRKTSSISAQKSVSVKNKTSHKSLETKKVTPKTPTPRKPVRRHVSCHHAMSKMTNVHSSTIDRDEKKQKRPLSTNSNPKSANPRFQSVARSVSLSEIPFGNSAFSALDLPLGAEANNLKKMPSKRNSSFAVPNVLKMVYNGGKKIALDNAEPPKAGLSQPNSVESWLNTTSDPFIDTPTSSEMALEESVYSNEKSNGKSECKGAMMDKQKNDQSNNCATRQDSKAKSGRPLNSSESSTCKGGSSPSLRRAPAKRKKSCSKSIKATPLKESIITAFHGESVMKKPKSSSPYDFIGLRIREEDRSPSSYPNILAPGSDFNKDGSKRRDLKFTGKTLTKSDRSNPEDDDDQDDENNNNDSNEEETSNTLPRWSAMQNYTHNLSTILSESSSNNNSKSQSIPEYLDSNPAVTQETIHTTPTNSILPSVSHQQSVKTNGSKRMLTKHSDLISILSLSNTTDPANPGSIRPARSLRANRRHNCTASTVDHVLIVLAEEETQYMQELDTLVDGVIPVLLKCISNSNASELFHSLEGQTLILTQSIIDMGNALISLRNHHKYIPLADAYALLMWAGSARPVYEDYLRAWRSGFEDIVVNLTPIASSPIGNNNEIKRDQNGDLLGERGEKIVVADLLRKPIIRIKHISRALKSLNKFSQTYEASKQISSDYETLLEFRALRIKEENARMIDQQAWTLDTSRARDLRNLEGIDQLEINKYFQVVAKDCFSLEIPHSTGQRINCGVELVLRNLPGRTSEGDLLILKDDIKDPFLLFAPLLKRDLSARLSETRQQIIIMVRDSTLRYLQAEFLVLNAQDESIAEDWIKMLGEYPVPPPISRTLLKISPALESVISSREADTTSVMRLLNDIETDKATPPLGERANEGKFISSSWNQASSQKDHDSSQYSGVSDEVRGNFDEENVKMMAAVDHPATKRNKTNAIMAQNYRLALDHQDIYAKAGQDIQEWGDYLKRSNTNLDQLTQSSEQQKYGEELDQKYAPETHLEPSSTEDTLTFREDDAPPPPVHKSPVAGILNNVPVFESTTPRGLTRRVSSPLKHEYRPSLTSEGSSEPSTDRDCSGSLSSDDKSVCDSDEDEMKEDENVEKRSNCSSNRESSFRVSSFINTIDSQTVLPLDCQEANANLCEKFLVVLSQWNPKTGMWLSLYPHACLALISNGLIECFKHDPSAPIPAGADLMKSAKVLFTQILTPIVQVRQSTAIDVEINSAIIAGEGAGSSSPISQRSDTLRYRLFGPSVCDYFYATVHQSCLRNETYLKLDAKSRIRENHGHAFDQVIENSGRRRRIFGLGRRRSYRASTRTRLENRGSGGPKNTSTALVAIQRLTGAGIFNISRSWAENSRWRGYHHHSSSHDLSTYTGSSSYSGGGGLTTSPHSPSSQAGNSDSLYSSGLTVRNLGTSNILFRLYYMLRNGNWHDYGQAFLSVSLPPPDMKQKAPLYNGPQKRITITRSPIPVTEVVTSAEVRKAGLMLDEVLGANLFVRMQKSGILLQTWEDVVSSEGDKESSGGADDSEHNSGAVRKFGSVAPRRHIWAMQFRRAGDAEWCWQLCRSGMP